jgi:gluconolactonase
MTRARMASHWTAAVVVLSGAVGAQDKPGVTPAIPGVVAAGTAIHIVKEEFDGTEGPLPQADGSLLFTENRANRVVRIAPDGTTSVWLASSGGANALAVTPKGEVVAALTEKPSIGVVSANAAPRVLVQDFEGKPFNRPNDLTVSRLGLVYFTDPGVAPAAGEAPKPTAVYGLAPDGKLARIADDIRRPNGVALSPDERTLYVANTGGEWLVAFDLDSKGAVKGRRDFAKLAGFRQTETGPSSGADGLAVDDAGRVYAATTAGVQVFSPKGEALGTIVLPKAPQNLAFAGKERNALYVVGRGSVYRIDTQTRGPKRAGK